MAKDLVVGNSSFEWFRDSLVTHAASLDLENAVQQLFDGSEGETALCLLNSASVVLFLDHVAVLDGHANHQSAFAAFQRGETVFKNMPWWDNSIWLPFDLSRIGTMEADPATFVGSCTSLHKELLELQRRSPLGLGAKPPGYEQMRQDISAFYSDSELQLGESDTIRWIWRALCDGAEIAINSRAILWGSPD